MLTDSEVPVFKKPFFYIHNNCKINKVCSNNKERERKMTSLPRILMIAAVLFALFIAGALSSGCDDDDDDDSATLDSDDGDDDSGNGDSDSGDDDDATDDDSGDDDDDSGPSIYEQLGGEQVVMEFLEIYLEFIYNDEFINWMYRSVDRDDLKENLHAYICKLAGGGCNYYGAPAVDVHSKMAITANQFKSIMHTYKTAIATVGLEVSEALDSGSPGDQLLLLMWELEDIIVTDPIGDQVDFNLYGGHVGVRTLVENFLTNVASDPNIGSFFDTADMERLEFLLVELIGEHLGGYLFYSGMDIDLAHASMCLTNGDFDDFVGNMVYTMDAMEIPYSPYLDGSEPGDIVLNFLNSFRAMVVTC